MRRITYDFEVFAHDWIVVFKDYESGQYTVIHNDNEFFKQCLSDDCYYVGFNSKHYDQFIAKAIYFDATPEEVKALNDYLIAGNQGWSYPPLEGAFFKFNNVDIKDDTQKGLSLKAIEGHLYMDIRETEVDFNLNRALTPKELEQTIFYCKHDVDATEQLTDIRWDYIKNKVHLGKLAGLSEVKAMSMTNAKLTAAMLKAEMKKHDDERAYEYPDNLLKEWIPQEAFDFFDRLRDPNLSDEEVFDASHEFMIGDCKCKLAFGGIHGAIPNYFWKECGDNGKDANTINT